LTVVALMGADVSKTRCPTPAHPPVQFIHLLSAFTVKPPIIIMIQVNPFQAA
jgi:hypothetical protein